VLRRRLVIRQRNKIQTYLRADKETSLKSRFDSLWEVIIMRVNKARIILWILSSFLICAMDLQAAVEMSDFSEDETFLPELRESDFSVLSGLEGFGVAVEKMPAGIAAEELTEKAIKEQIVSRLGEYGIGILSEEQVLKTENKPLLAINIISIADKNKNTCALLCSLALKEDMPLTRKQPVTATARERVSRAITWQRFEVKLCSIEEAGESIKAVVDYLAGVFAREFLAANPNFKKIEKGDEQMIPGMVRYIDIEGGFYGLLADTGEKYDPVNLPEDFRQDGLRVKFAVKEKQGAVSFRMWGKIVEILKIEQAKKSTDAVMLQWLGHASFKITCKDKVVYIDPWKLKDARNDAKIILVSHSHSDHYSPDDIKKVSTEETKLISSADVIEKEGWGQVLKPAHAVEVSGIKVTAVAAYNPAKAFHPRDKNWLGFIIDIGGIRIYYAGDTDLTEEMKALKDIDVALLPVGGKYTMDADQAAEAVKYIKCKKAIPYHFGDIVGSRDDANRFARQAGCEVIVMSPGEIKNIND
jgi:L-ascorbate metabolism protein UlaG (beta-lactamase superfamily)